MPEEGGVVREEERVGNFVGWRRRVDSEVILAKTTTTEPLII